MNDRKFINRKRFFLSRVNSENRLTTEAATYIGRAMAKSESLEVVRVSVLLFQNYTHYLI